MSKSYAVLPCNGLDKCAGCITGEVAIRLSEQSKSEIICPVFYRVAEAKYDKLAEEKPLLVIDGCATRCASKMAAENDVWAYVVGNKARIGVTDFVQKSLSDIMFFTPVSIGNEIEQFDELGDIESGKAVFGIISPVSGTVTALNTTLDKTPELINDNPYEQGWIAELELSDFESDKELLHTFDGYFSILKRKVDEFNVKS